MAMWLILANMMIHLTSRQACAFARCCATLGTRFELRRRAAVPAAAALAIDVEAVRRDHDRIFELDEAAARVLQRGLDRHYHPGFERPGRVVGVVGHRAARGEPRRLVAD